jgi:hypothetical protein
MLRSKEVSPLFILLGQLLIFTLSLLVSFICLSATEAEHAHDKRTEGAVKDKVASALDKITQHYQTGAPASPRTSQIYTNPPGSPETPHSPTSGSAGSILNLFKGGNGSSTNLQNASSTSSISR